MAPLDKINKFLPASQTVEFRVLSFTGWILSSVAKFDDLTKSPFICFLSK